MGLCLNLKVLFNLSIIMFAMAGEPKYFVYLRESWVVPHTYENYKYLKTWIHTNFFEKRPVFSAKDTFLDKILYWI